MLRKHESRGCEPEKTERLMITMNIHDARKVSKEMRTVLVYIDTLMRVFMFIMMSSAEAPLQCILGIMRDLCGSWAH